MQNGRKYNPPPQRRKKILMGIQSNKAPTGDDENIPVLMPHPLQATVDGFMADLKNLDSQIIGLSGNIATQLRRAAESVSTTVLASIPDLEMSEFFDSTLQFGFEDSTTENPRTLADLKAVLTSLVTEYDEHESRLVKKYFDDNKSKTTEGLAVLKETRKKLAGTIESFNVTAANMNSDMFEEYVPAVIPGAPRKNGVSESSSSKANTKGQQFYSIVDGVRKNQSTYQNKWSSLCYVIAPTMLELGEDRILYPKPTKMVEAFLSALGHNIPPSGSTPWCYEITLKDGSKMSVGMDVVSAAGENETNDDLDNFEMQDLDDDPFDGLVEEDDDKD